MEPHHVLEALGLLVSGALFYSYTYAWFPPGHPQRRRWWTAVLGLSFGGLAVILMIARIQVAEGVFVDARLVPVALIGLFEGWPAGLLAALVAAAYRLWLGGSGAGAGIAGLIATGLAAGVAHAWTAPTGRVRLRHTFVLSGIVYLISLGTFALLGRRGLALFGQVWLSHLVMLVVGIGLLAQLFQDVVEQHRLAAERARFRAILDEATDAIRIVDADTLRVLDCNRADCEMSGRSREEMIGRDVREFWPDDPEARARREAAMAEARAAGFARMLELPFRRADGRTLAVDSARRIVEYQGRRYEIVIYRDATERLAAEAALREAGELRSVTLLAQAAAHEINNPLAVILGYLQLLEGRVPGGGDEAKWVRLCQDAGLRIKEAIGRLSRIVRIESTEPTGPVPPILDTEKSSAETATDGDR